MLKLTKIALLLLAGAATAAPTDADIDAVVASALDVFDVPGMAVTVVHAGEPVHAMGHGIAEAGGRQKVDEHTLFRTGSLSKAFTAAALAVLADESRLDWDDPVIDYLPEFRMHDPWVTREFTIRDLLTHRSGLPLGAGDLLFFPDGNATAAEVVRALRHFEPATSFRSEFAYDNLLYVVAGEVVARVSGTPFPTFLEERVLGPLGMDACAATASRADGELETTTTQVTDLVAAAGGVTCSASGMAAWLRFMLNEGATADGEQILGAAQFRELVSPVTLLGVPGYLAEHAGSYLNAYALGWCPEKVSGLFFPKKVSGLFFQKK